LYYVNPQHEAADGYCDRSFNDNWCDTYFIICVTSSNSYESIKIAIAAYDSDRFTSHDLIANFENHVAEVPIPNTVVSADLVKTENTGHNEHVNFKDCFLFHSITALLALECIEGFYGEKCSIECFPEKYPSMLGCHENGTSICLPGKQLDYSAHCYAGYNPCVPSPCKNQGQCVRTGEKHDTFTCNCPIQWTGKLCHVQRSPCEVASQKLANADLQDLFGMHKKDNYTSVNDTSTIRSVNVCKNGGICVDLMEDFKFICNCTSGWKGELCTIPDWTNAIIAGCVVSGLVVILLCAVVPCCLRLRVLRQKKPKIPIEPLVYGHGDAKGPVTERIPFKDVFYNSVIMSDTMDSQNADNTQQFYEYCTVTSPSSREGDLSISTSNDYEISIEDKPPPELPIRPDSLAPLPKSYNTLICQDRDSLPSSRSESVYSRQPLLTPRTSSFLTPMEGEEHDSQNPNVLPKRSVENDESTLTKLLRIAKNSPNECNVAMKKTSVIGSQSRINEMVELPLSKGIPKSIAMRIEAWDSDLSTSDDLIARFVSTAVPISSHTGFNSVGLSKEEETSYNTEVRIDASVKLTCSPHYYGEQCETYCKPDYKSFYCGEKGERICIPGQRTPILTYNQDGRSACEWEKELLTSGTNSSTEICQNGGVCQDNPTEFGYTCLCSSGWKGQHCEEADYTAVVVAVTVILLALVMVAIFVIVIRRTRWGSKIDLSSIVTKCRKQPPRYSKSDDRTGRIEAISNEIYGEVPSNAVQVEVLSAEDEYAMLDATPQPPVGRRSYEGAIRYASLLWDSPPDPSLDKATEDKMRTLTPPLVPPRAEPNEITKSLNR
uniref:Delta-like protein n=1 Tax=Hydatigena taeniaeformis TaxID=6205 RepID=A0A0R3X7H6_HYDTA